MAALPQTGRQPAPPVRDARDKAAIARARLKACPADVAAAWSEDYPPPQSSFNTGHVEPVGTPALPKGCLSCFDGPGSYKGACMNCPSPPKRRKKAIALAS